MNQDSPEVLATLCTAWTLWCVAAAIVCDPGLAEGLPLARNRGDRLVDVLDSLGGARLGRPTASTPS